MPGGMMSRGLVPDELWALVKQLDHGGCAGKIMACWTS
ncbi:hypothetical protein AMETH_4501 [Amycolatopsis methanolica 239]|uniref:Uncharacterized protein n=1 Tax=Amycolatopsis methanolica 239 TaxID=1068978 RepID=A0A076MUQ3_AMYME|nr:hypothetical protein AMETH_4501 [Amycolatopsis methanolica 239]